MRTERRLRALVQLVAMCVLLAVNAAAASPAHHHSDAIGSDCVLCCVGHLPVLQSQHGVDIRPASRTDWHAAIEEFQPDLDSQFTATPGRAPPAL